MSYPIETKKKFIALRARGSSIQDLADDLKVPHSTLGDWNKRFAHEIALARAVNWEHAETIADMIPEQDLTLLADLIHRTRAEIDRRPLHLMKTSDLLRLHFAARREYTKRIHQPQLLLVPLSDPATRDAPVRIAPAGLLTNHHQILLWRPLRNVAVIRDRYISR